MEKELIIKLKVSDKEVINERYIHSVIKTLNENLFITDCIEYNGKIVFDRKFGIDKSNLDI